MEHMTQDKHASIRPAALAVPLVVLLVLRPSLVGCVTDVSAHSHELFSRTTVAATVSTSTSVGSGQATTSWHGSGSRCRPRHAAAIDRALLPLASPRPTSMSLAPTTRAVDIAAVARQCSVAAKRASVAGITVPTARRQAMLRVLLL